MSSEEFRQLVLHFCGQATATETARMMGVQRKTINNVFQKIRERIAETLERESPFTYEDEQGNLKGGYNGVEFIRDRDAVGKLDPMFIGVFTPRYITPVLGGTKLKKIKTEVLPDVNPRTLNAFSSCEHSLIQVFTYIDLFDLIRPPKVGIDLHADTFQRFFMRRIRLIYGMAPQTRYLRLKENEWRFNNREPNWSARLFELLARNPL